MDLIDPSLDNTFIQLPMLKDWGDGLWRTQANCKTHPTDDFFPKRGPGIDNSLPIARARMVCLQCPVRLECATFALTNNMIEGTYGGLPPGERRALSADTITEKDVQITLRKAAFFAKRATKKDPAVVLSAMLGTTVEWVRNTLRDDPNYLI